MLDIIYCRCFSVNEIWSSINRGLL